MNYKKISTLILAILIISIAFIQTSISIGIDYENSNLKNSCNTKVNSKYILWFLNVHFELINNRLFIWKEPEIDPLMRVFLF